MVTLSLYCDTIIVAKYSHQVPFLKLEVKCYILNNEEEPMGKINLLKI